MITDRYPQRRRKHQPPRLRSRGRRARSRRRTPPRFCRYRHARDGRPAPRVGVINSPRSPSSQPATRSSTWATFLSITRSATPTLNRSPCRWPAPAAFPSSFPSPATSTNHTRDLVERGLEFDMLLLSGGVSAGKYDIVERVLADLGAEFFFDRVLIQPGQPLVFGRVRDKFFFGLPGNPGSTMVTFELFARCALELLSGESESTLPLLWSKLATDFRARGRAHPLSARPPQRRRQRDHPRAMDRIGRCTRTLSRQCLPRHRARSRKMVRGRPYSSAPQMKDRLTHFDAAGTPRMVDVSAKAETKRTARAHAFVRIKPEVLAKLLRPTPRATLSRSRASLASPPRKRLPI